MSKDRAHRIADRVEQFVRSEIIPYENDPRWGRHGPTEELALELKNKARQAGLLCPHILPEGGHLTHRETAVVLRAAGLSPLGPVSLNVPAPDAGNMYLLGR